MIRQQPVLRRGRRWFWACWAAVWCVSFGLLDWALIAADTNIIVVMVMSALLGYGIGQMLARARRRRR